MDSISVDKAEAAHVDEIATQAAADEEKALVRKVDLYLMPAMWLMYLFSYADRTKYGSFILCCRCFYC